MCGPVAAFDHEAAEALALDAAGAFSRGLRSLVDAAGAAATAAAEKERRRLSEERLQLEAEAARLEAEWAQLEAERAKLGTGRPSPPPGSEARRRRSSPSAAPEAPSCNTLAQLPESVLAATLSGRCESADEAGGHVLIDFSPGLLMHALEHFREERHPPPERHPQAGDLEREFREILAHYSVRGWVYRHPPSDQDLAPTSLRLGRREYAVLPQAEPNQATVLLDMFDSTVNVPVGWEVLLADAADGFDDVVASLARHGWGTSLLCVKNAEGGFSSYRTVLYTHGGTAGSRVSGDSKVVKALDSCGRQFGFSKGMVLSGRLVICKVN